MPDEENPEGTTEMVELETSEPEEKEKKQKKGKRKLIQPEEKKQMKTQKKEPLGFVKWKLFSLLLYSIMFTCGSSWKSLVFAIMFGTFDWNPRDTATKNIIDLWLTTLLMNAFLVFLIYVLMRLKKKLLLKEESILKKKVIGDSIDLMINWGLCFAIAEISFIAVECSLPKKKYFHVIYVFSCIGFIAIISGIINGNLIPSCNPFLDSVHGDYREDIANTVFNGSVWALTVMWVNSISYLFNLHNLLAADSHISVGYLWLYNIVFILFAVSSSLILRYYLGKNHANLKELLKKDHLETEEDIDEEPLIEKIRDQVRTLQETWFFLYLKSMSMVCVFTTSKAAYLTVLVYVMPGNVSIYQPLPLGPATTFLCLVVLLVSVIGLVVEHTTHKSLQHSRLIHKTSEDASLSNLITSIFNEFTEEVIDFGGQTFMTGLSWVCGNAFHGWSYSVWTLLTSAWLNQDNKDERIVLVTVYVVLLNFLAAFTSMHIVNQKTPGIEE